MKRVVCSGYRESMDADQWVLQMRIVVVLAVLGSLVGSVFDADAAGCWSVQVMTLSHAERADAQVAGLRRAGRDAYLSPVVSRSGGQLYRVRFGRFAARADAERAAESYRAATGASCLVVPAACAPAAAGGARAAQPDAPVPVTTLYAYRWPADELHFARSRSAIPAEATLEYVSRGPAWFTGRIDDRGRCGFRIGDRETWVVLAGVRFVPGSAQSVAAAVTRLLAERPARLLCPAADDAAVQVFAATGVSVNEKLLAAGVAAFCEQTALPDDRAELAQTAAKARARAVGIWRAGHTP